MLKNTRLSAFLEKQTGFTLIELLVTISIIAILSALLMVNFIGARQRGRDGVKKADLRQMQAALELYRSDQGFYPQANDLANCGGSLQSISGTVYMQKIPCMDEGTNDPYTYIPDPVSCTNTSGSYCTGYDMFACLENEQDQEIATGINDGTTQCDTTGGTSFPFMLSNP